MQKKFKIKGMHCNSCVQRIEDSLKEKVDKVTIDFSKETLDIDFDDKKISEQEIKDIVKSQGYELLNLENKDNKIEIQKEEKPKSKNRFGWYVFIGSLVVLAIVLYKLFGGIDLQIPAIGENGSLILLFFVGILTGFHCISMCGGFVVSYTAKNAIKGHKGFKQHLVYGGAKLFSYALIGGLFGLLGGFVAFSVGLRGTVAILAGLFMIFYSLSMFGIKFFRKFQFNPKFLMRWSAKASKEAKGYYKGPLITGLLGGLFIACGSLQAMYLYAAGSGSFFTGVTSLAAFGLGTLPVMIGFGSMATVISHNTTKKILKFSAIIVLILGLIMLNRGLTVMGSSVSYDSLKEKVVGVKTNDAILVGGYQEINMDVSASGYSPNSFVLKKGVPVKWNINVVELTGCNNEIIARDYGIDVKLKKGLNVVEFTPEETGTIRFSCWMGMIRGSFIVTETGEASSQELSADNSDSAGSCGGSCGSPTCGGSTGGGCGCGG